MPRFGKSEEIRLAKQEKRRFPGKQPNFYVWLKGENGLIVLEPHIFGSFWYMFDNYSVTKLPHRHYVKHFNKL